VLRPAVNGVRQQVVYGNGKSAGARLPWLMWFILISLIATFFDQETPLGRNLKGVLLFATIGLSLAVIVAGWRRVCFPISIWLPWMALTAAYCAVAVAEEEWEWGQAALQRTLMMWAPPLVGAAVSTFPIDERGAARFIRICKIGVFILFGLLIFRLGLPRFGRPWWVGSHQMTAALLAALFAVLYAHGETKAMLYWGAMMLICVLGVGRGTTAAVASTLPFTLAPMRLTKRALLGLAMAILGVAVFYYEPFQQEWFRSGHGELRDLRPDNPDIDDSGRLGTWEVMMPEIRKRPWLGNGANANEKALFQWLGFRGQPHNEYVRLVYDYGVVGTAVFFSAVVVQCAHTALRARRATPAPRAALLAGASAFVPMLVIMVGDNIVIYSSFFGNLHFLMLGLGYASAERANGLGHARPFKRQHFGPCEST